MGDDEPDLDSERLTVTSDKGRVRRRREAKTSAIGGLLYPRVHLLEDETIVAKAQARGSWPYASGHGKLYLTNKNDFHTARARPRSSLASYQFGVDQ